MSSDQPAAPIDPVALIDQAALAAAIADPTFSGVVRIDRGDEQVFAAASGFAHRALQSATTAATRFAVASGSKAFTALAVLALVERGTLRLDQPARELLGTDLPLIDDDVTLEHLLGHTSGIGDYLDEDDDIAIEEFFLPLPVHTLTTAEAFLPMLEGKPAKFAAGTGFSYCNSGYAVLAIVLERVTGRTYHDAVRELVLDPAGLEETGFLRTDELPGDVAQGYLFDHGDRTNTLHLPVLATGDGGAVTSATDVHRFWRALYAGRIVTAETVARMTAPRGGDDDMRYGLGFWVHPSTRAVVLEGYDAGVSFRSLHLPALQLTATVLSNTADGAWPIARLLADAVDEALAD